MEPLYPSIKTSSLYRPEFGKNFLYNLFTDLTIPSRDFSFKVTRLRFLKLISGRPPLMPTRDRSLSITRLLLFLKSFLMPWIDTEFMLFRPRKSPSLSSNFELLPSVILRLLAFSGSVSPSPPRIYSYIFESDWDVIKINYWLCMHEVFIRKLLSKKFTDGYRTN